MVGRGCGCGTGVSESGHGCRWRESRCHRCCGEPEVHAWLDVDVPTLETASSRSISGVMERPIMNEYAVMARDHWKKWLPDRYNLLEDPDNYFQSLGERASDQVSTMVLELQASHRQELNDLEYLPRVGRINAYRQQAREIVLAELLPSPPEDSTETTVDPVADLMDRDGMPIDQDHPLWAMEDDPTVSARQWETARQEWEDNLRSRTAP